MSEAPNRSEGGHRLRQDRAAILDLIDLPQVIERLKETSFFVAEHLLEELLARDRERKAIRQQDEEGEEDPTG